MPRARDATVCVPAATMASDVGKSTAAPMPARAWPAHRMPTRAPVEVPTPGVRTLTNSPTASSTLPPISSRLRPNRSPRTPHVSSSSATGTRNASEIQVSWDAVVPRSCWNSPLSTAGIASPTCPAHAARAVATVVATVSDGVCTAMRGRLPVIAMCTSVRHVNG